MSNGYFEIMKFSLYRYNSSEFSRNSITFNSELPLSPLNSSGALKSISFTELTEPSVVHHCTRFSLKHLNGRAALSSFAFAMVSLVAALVFVIVHRSHGLLRASDAGLTLLTLGLCEVRGERLLLLRNNPFVLIMKNGEA